MFHHFSKDDLKICVGVKDHHTGKKIVKFAENFCRRTGAVMHLVHSVGESYSGGWDVMTTADTNMSDLLDLSMEERRGEAQIMLFNLAETVDPEIDTEIAVVDGRAVPSLIAEARRSDSSLILVSTETHGRSPLPGGWSTALGLIKAAPLPVLVADHESDVDLAGPLRMLVADDFTEACRSNIHNGVDLATRLGQCHVNHVHVHELPVGEFKKVYQSVWPGRKQAEEEWDRVHDDFLKKMEERAPLHTDRLEDSGGRYTCELECGEVEVGLDWISGRFEPDLMVFGRHRTLHRRPMHVGRVPFGWLFRQKGVFLILPEEEKKN